MVEDLVSFLLPFWKAVVVQLISFTSDHLVFIIVVVIIIAIYPTLFIWRPNLERKEKEKKPDKRKGDIHRNE